MARRAARLPAPPDPRHVMRRAAPRRAGSLTLFGVTTTTGRRRAAVIVRRRTGRLKSHDRHRVQRLLREILRLHQHELPPSIDVVAMATCGAAQLPTFHELTDAFTQLCRSTRWSNTAS